MPITLAPPVIVVQSAPVAAPGDATAPLRVDIKGRPMIPATIDGKGPMPMIVDTGAAGTVLRVDTARSLNLPRSSETIAVSGVALSEQAAFYKLNRLASPLFELTDLALPAVSSIGTTQARGVLGMDLFAARKLVFDRALQEVRVAPSGPAPTGYETVVGTYSPGDGLFVPLRIDGVEVVGLIDSGAEATLIGADTLAALGWKNDDPRLAAFGSIGGAGGGGAAARIATLGSLELGGARFAGMRVIVTESAKLATRPGSKPRIIIGLDLLNRLRSYAVDAPRREFQFATFATRAE